MPIATTATTAPIAAQRGKFTDDTRCLLRRCLHEGIRLDRTAWMARATRPQHGGRAALRERGLDALDRGRLGRVTAFRSAADGLGELQYERAVALELVGRLRAERRDSRLERLVRRGVDLARRRDRAEARAVL